MPLKKPLSAQQLRLIHAISQTGKLDHAAQIVHISQPAASRMLAAIEDQVGQKLFDRHPKGMSATSIGTLLSEKAGTILRNMDDLTEAVAALEDGGAGHLKVGAVTGPAIDVLMPAIAEAKSASPRLEVSVEVGPSRFLMDELIAGRLEFVIARLLPEYDPHAFRIEPGRDEEVCFLTAQHNPLAQADNLSISDLHDAEWVIQQRGNPIRDAVADAFRLQGLEEPENVVNSPSTLFVVSYLAQGRAVAAVTKEVAQLLTSPPISAGFARLNVRDEIRVPPFYLITARGRSLSPAAQKMMASTRRLLRGTPK